MDYKTCSIIILRSSFEISLGRQDASSYLEKIIGAGFDGVYLDIIDGFEYFEGKYPKE